MQDCTSTAKVFEALRDKTRVGIIQFLGSGEKCACHISEELDIAQSKLSYHMKILCESGLVESWYVGKWTHYQISTSLFFLFCSYFF
ncbi:MAG: metalloregulator ArsR/SmtB family transcription factor [Eubacteriales bacterium]